VTLPEPVYSSYPQFSYGQGYNPGLSQVEFLFAFFFENTFSIFAKIAYANIRNDKKNARKERKFRLFERLGAPVRTILAETNFAF
jgi:hypothetical protein